MMLQTKTMLACGLLAVLAVAPQAMADTDPIPDSVEALACGSAPVSSAINGLPPVAGRCVTSTNYASPLLEPATCVDCSSDSTGVTDQPLTPGDEAGPIGLPPEDIPGVPTNPTPPVNLPVATIQGAKHPDGERYCITVTPSTGSPPPPSCVDVGPAWSSMPNLGPVSLIGVGSVNPPDVPPTDEGDLGTLGPYPIPALSFDLTVDYRWVEARLNPRFTGAVEVWEPVDMDSSTDLTWWANNGQLTDLGVRLVLKADGSPLQVIEARVPFAGQTIAAVQKSG